MPCCPLSLIPSAVLPQLLVTSHLPHPFLLPPFPWFHSDSLDSLTNLTLLSSSHLLFILWSFSRSFQPVLKGIWRGQSGWGRVMLSLASLLLCGLLKTLDLFTGTQRSPSPALMYPYWAETSTEIIIRLPPGY